MVEPPRIRINHEETLRKAYTAVCAKKTSTIQKTRLNVVGHPRAGASTFVQQILGEKMTNKDVSHDFIKIHSVKMGHLTWEECSQTMDQITEHFNELLVTEVENTESNFELLSQESTPLTINSRTKIDFTTFKGIFRGNKHQEHPVFLKIWDFDGQNKFRAAQELFLEPEVATLIVMDMSKSLHKPLHEGLQSEKSNEELETPAEYLIYYLETIHLKALERSIQHPISLFLTHRDKIPQEIRKSYINSYLKDIHELLEGKPYAEYLSDCNIHITDNKVEPADMTGIRKFFTDFISCQQEWGNEIPARWSQLEADVKETSVQDSVKYFQTSVVREMATAYGMHEDEVDSFLEFHHSVGDWIYCLDAGTVVTDPQWLLNAIQDLFKTFDTLGPVVPLELLNNGLASEKALETIWKGEDIAFLINLIINLHLMILLPETENRKYLIPSLLPRSATLMQSPDNMAIVYDSLHKLSDIRNIALDAYHKLLCRLGNETGWKIHEGQPSHFNAYFTVTEDLLVALTLVQNQIKLSIWCTKGIKYANLENSLQTILETVRELLEKTGIPENAFFQMMCPHSQVGDDCLVKINMVKNPEIILLPEETKCPVHNKDLSPKDFKLFHPEMKVHLHSTSNLGGLIHEIKISDVKGKISYHYIRNKCLL